MAEEAAPRLISGKNAGKHFRCARGHCAARAGLQPTSFARRGALEHRRDGNVGQAASATEDWPRLKVHGAPFA
eukprot:2761965-Pyramimonas_sp.AAC.1